MASDRFLLDSSAILTLIEDEPGADRVEAVLRSGRPLLPWVCLLEVHYVTQQERGLAEADRRLAYLRQLPVEVLWQADEAVLLRAARFKAQKRLSLADAVIAGYAATRAAVLLHKDPEFEPLADEVVLESLPYKA